MSMTEPRPISTIDLFKSAAVLMMVVDHIGFYFMTEQLETPTVGDPALWWRVVGRLSVPVWFFLIGYGGGRSISLWLLTGAVVLEVANIVTGMFLFPLNVLFSMIIIRLILDRLARVVFSSLDMCALFWVGTIIFCLYGNFFMEYGLLGVLIALAGYAVRQKKDPRPGVLRPALFRHSFFVPIFAWTVAVFAAAAQFSLFPWMSMAQFTVQAVGVLAMFALLFHTPFTTYPDLTRKIAPSLASALRFTGRRTMEIYVAHLILFKVLALVFGLGYPIYGWFDWDWTIVGAFEKSRSLGG